jgi:hypothetical protein
MALGGFEETEHEVELSPLVRPVTFQLRVTVLPFLTRLIAVSVPVTSVEIVGVLIGGGGTIVQAEPSHPRPALQVQIAPAAVALGGTTL